MKQILLIICALAIFGEIATAQAPNFSYAPNSLIVTVGSPFSSGPANTGGLVPATIYGQVTTIAGSGKPGYTNNTATLAQFNLPEGIVGDAAGNLYVSDTYNNAIRKIAPNGAVTTLAGSSVPNNTGGFADGVGTAAIFKGPTGIAINAAGTTLFVSDYGNKDIRKIDIASRTVTTLATGISGAYGLCLDSSGNLIVAEETGHIVVRVNTTDGTVTILAGNGSLGYYNSTVPTGALFAAPEDVQLDATGNIFVVDYTNNVIRKIAVTGEVTTLAGPAAYQGGSYADGVGAAARFNLPTGVAIGNGNILYIADKDNNDIRRILPDGTVTTVAGNQAEGVADGIGTASTFFHPFDLYIDGIGTGYISDCRNGNIRKIALTGYTIDQALPAGLSFNSATGVISGTATAAFPATNYTITAYNSVGYFSKTITLSSSNSWIGNVSSDWNDPRNWSLNQVPATGETAAIGVAPYPDGAYQPTFGGGPSSSVGNIQFGTNNSPVLTITSGQALTATNGVQVNAGSTATINGPGNIILGGASLINASSSLTASANLVITLAASSTLTNNGTCTLSSDANGSASIAAIPSNSSVIGNLSVQRYISGVRSYRLLSSPVYNSSAKGNHIYTINYLLKSTFESGTGSGFNKVGNPSLYLYREDITGAFTNFLNTNYRGIADISAPPDYPINFDGGPFNIPVANGFLMFFRGGLDTPTPFVVGSPATATAVTATGTLNQGTIIFKDWFTPTSPNLSLIGADPKARGFNLVGNPYPSSIDWDQFSDNSSASGIYGPNVDNTLYVLNLSGSYGAYKAKGAPGSGTNGASNIIPSGAGFFVLATSTSASLTLNENAKTSAQVTGNNLLMSTAAQAKVNNQFFRLQMVLDSIHQEDIIIRFNGSAKTIFDRSEDALYIKGFAPISLSSLSSDGVPLAINQQPLPKQQSVSVGLNIAATASGAYQLKMKDLNGLPQLYDIWLMDAFKKDSVNLRSNSTYSFDINNSDTTSFGGHRLSIVMRQNPAFAYHLLDFSANKVADAKQVDVVWKTQYEGNYTNFTVERSTDNGASYQVLGGVTAADQGTYSFLDKAPATGTNLYRLKQEDINNTVSYSKIVTIQYSNLSNSLAGNKLSIYPNPAGSMINLDVANQSRASAAYNIRFMNSAGLVVKEVMSSQTTWQGNISNLQPGTYIIRVTDHNTQALVGENKFVKL